MRVGKRDLNELKFGMGIAGESLFDLSEAPTHVTLRKNFQKIFISKWGQANDVQMNPNLVWALGWARKNKSAQNQLLAWAHMPMGIESSHTKFGVILFSQLVPANC